MHLDLETDDIEAEVQRLEALGATRYDHQQERGFDFWVLRDPSACSTRTSRSWSPGAGHGPARSCLQYHSSDSTLAAMVA
jgi:hypothetical protein